jgi:hypothetical protein
MGEAVGPVAGAVVGRSGLGTPFLLSAGASGVVLVAASLLHEKRTHGECGGKADETEEDD